MLSNEELKERFKKVHPEYLDIDKNGGYKWKCARVYTTILYPENIIDIEDSCCKLGIPCSLSPLHDSDLKDESTGEIKKPHYHLIVYYKGKTTPYNFYNSLCGAFGDSAFSTIEIGRDLGALVRYSCHLDNEDKAQYKIEDIKDFNGFHSNNYLYDCGVDFMGNLKELKKIAKENNIIFYSELDDYLEENNEYLHVALHKDRNLIRDIRDYMKSREHEMFYSGDVQKGYTKIKMENGTEKVIFNRQIKAV